MGMQIKEKTDTTFSNLKDKFGYKNSFEAPRVSRVVVSTGVGSIQSKDHRELIEDRLTLITGQKASKCNALKSIASFKLREGDLVGFKVTLRRKRMYDFLEKLFHVALPRTKDFKGISRKCVDEMGNMTIGIKEHTIFPETPDEEMKNVFGLSVVIVTTASDKETAESFLEHLGAPLKEKDK